MSDSIVQAVLVITYVIQFLILARVVMSWLPIGNNPVTALVMQVTEPLLAPIRRVLPRMGMIDLAPMILILVVIVIQRVVVAAGD
ncbi:MAG: YggT family protein [Dehalococcoidia bacterium]|nr:YggT family protein [Dehalococcoidia bacterium]